MQNNALAVEVALRLNADLCRQKQQLAIKLTV